MQSIDTPSILVALPQLQDPNFFRSIVLLLECNDEGALGFVINKPSTFSMRELLLDADEDIPEAIISWTGGPVQVERGLVLHNQGGDLEASHFSHQIALSSSPEAVRGLIHHAQNLLGGVAGEMLYPYRFLIGYAGWGPGQLMEELLANSWIQVPYSEKLVFDTPWPEMWSEAMRMIGVDPYEIIPSTNPYLN